MPVNRPLRVFGDPARLRDQVRRLIRRGEELLAQLSAAEDLYAERAAEFAADPLPESGLAAAFRRYELGMDIDHLSSIGAWGAAVRRQLLRGLGGGGDRQIHKVGLPRNVRDYSPEEFLKLQRRYVDSHLEDLHRVLARLPTTEPVSTPQAAEFRELRASGLIEEVQLNAYLKRMASLKTRPQMSAAIGAAKELVESVLIAALELLDPEVTHDHEFPRLAKQVRQRIESRLVAEGLSLDGGAQKQLLNGLVSIENALAALRNEVGEGHGRPRSPKALAARHARLAIDTAHTYTAYVVGCLVDLRLVRLEPPPGAV